MDSSEQMLKKFPQASKKTLPPAISLHLEMLNITIFSGHHLAIVSMPLIKIDGRCQV